MSRQETGVPRDFMLKQIENEIRAGFVFVAAAREALALSHSAEAEGALKKASQTHQQATVQAANSPVEQVRAVTHQLSELREAIDWLREAHLSRAAEK